MRTNQSLLQKADLALSDLASNGGLLLPEQANTFIRKLIKTPTIIRECRVVTMTAPQRKINKIGFGSRILRPAVSGTALSSSDRAKPTTEQVQLNTSEVIAEVRLPYDVLEDNIESAGAANNETSNAGPGGLRDTIIQLIAERAALDLEELSLLGDTGSGDAYLALQNGFLKIADTYSNIVDAGGATVTKALFKAGKKAMPDQYLRDVANMRHFVSVDQETEYRDTMADRATALGDSIIDGTRTLNAYGAPVVPVPMMPDAKGIYTNSKNLIMGIQRQISLEYDKSITERTYIIVLTARVALQIEEREAVVLYKNLG